MGVHDELIYLARGMIVLDGPFQNAVSVVTTFNTTSGTWQRLLEKAANIPEGRQRAASAIGNDTFFVVGGRWFEKSNVRDEVFRTARARLLTQCKRRPPAFTHARASATRRCQHHPEPPPGT